MKELIKLFCICLFVALVRTSIAFITIITLLENKHFINDDWSFSCHDLVLFLTHHRMLRTT